MLSHRLAPRLFPRSSIFLHRYFGSVTPFHLTDIGEGTAEVEIKSWAVALGDTVGEFDPLLEVESDKATVEITSRLAGKVTKLYFEAGDIAPVGSVLCDIEVEGEADEAAATPAPQPTQSPAAVASTPAAGETAPPASVASSGKVLATPAVRRLAREHKIDLTSIAGSGKRGRILKDDVIAVTRGSVAASPASTTSGAVATGASAGAVPEDRVEPVRGLKRTMTKVMTQAWTVPQFLYCDEVKCDALVQARAQLKPLAEAQGIKLTYMPFMIKAASLALKEFPIINSTFDAEAGAITYKGAHNIGVAMQTPDGLLVPNIKNVQTLSILEIAQELTRLQALGAAGKLGKDELSGGTFTLSNVGVVGGTYTKPLLVPPESCIGALGKMYTVPRYANDAPNLAEYGAPVPTRILSVSWSADHRTVDGVTLASFSNAWKGYLETPINMLAATI